MYFSFVRYRCRAVLSVYSSSFSLTYFSMASKGSRCTLKVSTSSADALFESTNHLLVHLDLVALLFECSSPDICLVQLVEEVPVVCICQSCLLRGVSGPWPISGMNHTRSSLRVENDEPRLLHRRPRRCRTGLRRSRSLNSTKSRGSFRSCQLRPSIP